jgi:hypothetical protein
MQAHNLQGDSPGRNVRFPISSDAASPAPASSNGIPLPSMQSTGPPANGTTDANQQLPGQADRQWETKILIAAGAIGLVIVIAVAVLVFWRVRNKHKKIQSDKGHGDGDKPQSSSEEPKLGTKRSYNPRAPLGRPWSIGPLNPRGTFRDKDQWDVNSSVGSLLYKPAPVFSRVGPASSPSLLGAQPSRSPFPPPNPMSTFSRLAERNMLFFDTHQSHDQLTPSISQTRRASVASSSPVLPIEGPGLASNSPSVAGSEQGQKRRSSTPSIVEISNSLGHGEKSRRRNDGEDWKPSRFSWTKSMAPKAPPDPSSRFSIATSVSSAPRHRTVESWVGNQTYRLDEGKFQEYLEREIEDRISVAVTNGSPQLNGRLDTTREDSPKLNDYELPKQNNSSPETGSSGRRLHSESREYGKRQRRCGRENHLNVPRARDSSAYMAHPGTRVSQPRVSLIPSEILDGRLGHGTL